MVLLVVFPDIEPGLIVQLPDGNPLNTTLPVGTAHVGCVIVPTTGAVGVAGCVLMTTFPDAGDVHPEEFVTVKLYVLAAKPDIVVLVVDPAIAPGLIVQLPEGKLLKTTLPVASTQVGCVIVPTTGAVGVAGCVLITTFADAGEIHPAAFVTVKLYVFADKPDIVVLEPDPATPPGFIVQLPEGRPLNTTLPVAKPHVGCVIDPTTGAVGKALTVTETDPGTVLTPSKTDTLYVILEVGFAVGFARVDEKPAGVEVQVYVNEPEPPVTPAFNWTLLPAHTVLGVAVGFTVGGALRTALTRLDVVCEACTVISVAIPPTYAFTLVTYPFARRKLQVRFG